MGSRKNSILAVDDDPRMLRMLVQILETQGYRACGAPNGETAMAMMETETPDLIMLDVMMPGMDGYAVCRNVREFSEVPIIMVTARGDEQEKVRCLDAGADDFITKPFSYKELAARVRAVLRRTKSWDDRPEAAFAYDELVVDFGRNIVTMAGKQVSLTATEYKLLSYLARNVGCIVTPDQILEKVWGEAYKGETHLLQVSMARLRQRLKDDARNPRYILTRHGIGYTMGCEDHAMSQIH